MTPQNSFHVPKNTGNNLVKPDYPTQQSIQQQAGDSQTNTESRLLALEAMIHNHHHNGSEASGIQLNTDVRGLLETVSAVPTGVPQNLFDQVKIYVNGTTYRLYVYDANAQTWHYASLT